LSELECEREKQGDSKYSQNFVEGTRKKNYCHSKKCFNGECIEILSEYII